MRGLFLTFLFVLLVVFAVDGKAADTPLVDGVAETDGTDGQSTADTKTQRKDKRKPKNAKKRAAKAAAVAESKRVPSAVANENPALIDAWKNQRTQLRNDLGDIYEKNPVKVSSKAKLINQAVAVYEAWTNLGMKPPEAVFIIKGMAMSRDRDSAFDAIAGGVRGAVAAKVPNDKIALDFGRIARNSSSAETIIKAIDAWNEENVKKPAAEAAAGKPDTDAREAEDDGGDDEEAPPPVQH